MIAHSSKEVRAAALGTAAAMKWMKWIGRSLVERAAAAAFPDLRETPCLAENKSPSNFSP